jgi:lipoprotein
MNKKLLLVFASLAIVGCSNKQSQPSTVNVEDNTTTEEVDVPIHSKEKEETIIDKSELTAEIPDGEVEYSGAKSVVENLDGFVKDFSKLYEFTSQTQAEFARKLVNLEQYKVKFDASDLHRLYTYFDSKDGSRTMTGAAKIVDVTHEKVDSKTYKLIIHVKYAQSATDGLSIEEIGKNIYEIFDDEELEFKAREIVYTMTIEDGLASLTLDTPHWLFN